MLPRQAKVDHGYFLSEACRPHKVGSESGSLPLYTIILKIERIEIKITENHPDLCLGDYNPTSMYLRLLDAPRNTEIGPRKGDQRTCPGSCQESRLI